MTSSDFTEPFPGPALPSRPSPAGPSFPGSQTDDAAAGDPRLCDADFFATPTSPPSPLLLSAGRRATGLLSFDFDGTLVHPPEILHPPAQFHQALTTLRARGVAWVVNTGRNLAYALDGLAEAGLLATPPDFLLLREQEIWQPDGHGHWTDCGDWNQLGRSAFQTWHQRHETLLATIRGEWETLGRGTWLCEDDDPAGLMGWDASAIEAFVPRLWELRAEHPELTWQRNGIWLRFCAAGYDKGSILKHLAQRLGVPRERIFAIGDNFNDLEMLHPEVAGRFACPGNTVPAVAQRVAERGGWLLDPPASYGVAEALERLLDEGW